MEKGDRNKRRRKENKLLDQEGREKKKVISARVQMVNTIAQVKYLVWMGAGRGEERRVYSLGLSSTKKKGEI